ncbi:hypothetical protein LCGC14_2581160 [marine sediment metagenome]|uniref:Uncharacterized protein n=1 Tax=marine sediment metagenome TaxID=412755 RepID=A0A0F9B2A1_9ZZZZ
MILIIDKNIKKERIIKNFIKTYRKNACNTLCNNSTMGRKTIPQSISFQPDVWNFLKERKNISTIVNEAVREYRKIRTTPELKIKMLKIKKKEHAQEIYKISEEIKDLEEK